METALTWQECLDIYTILTMHLANYEKYTCDDDTTTSDLVISGLTGILDKIEEAFPKFNWEERRKLVQAILDDAE